jgi:RNA polymerase sigma factor (sigma-70 family)
MYRQRQELDSSSPPTGAVPSSGPSTSSGGASGGALFVQAQAGCRESLNELMRMHDGLVHAVVRRQVLGDLPYAEAVQAARIGLWRAILGYDPDRGGAFSTYAWPCILHHVWREVKAYTRAWRTDSRTLQDAHQVERASAACLDPAECYWASAVADALYDLLARLPRRLQAIMVARYGLGGQRARYYREIGEWLGISGERARQLHTAALVWLRHPAHSQHLRSLLGRHTRADYEWAEALAQRWLRRRGGRDGRYDALSC